MKGINDLENGEILMDVYISSCTSTCEKGIYYMNKMESKHGGRYSE